MEKLIKLTYSSVPVLNTTLIQIFLGDTKMLPALGVDGKIG